MLTLLGSIGKLAVQKFSSIVVEKCLAEGDEDIRDFMVHELVDPQRLPRLLLDPYANYVIQKVLTVSKREKFEYLVHLIRPHLDAMGTTPLGKRIQVQMLRKFPILSIDNHRAGNNNQANGSGTNSNNSTSGDQNRSPNFNGSGGNMG